MTTPKLITLRYKATRLQICPAAGGSIVRFWHEDHDDVRDWLRPVSQETLAKRQGRDMGSYPLVPYCNRIREGRFEFQGRRVQLPLNAKPMRHSIHGHGWQADWQIISVNEHQVCLAYIHQADDWPWDYRVQQTLSLGRQSLAVEMQLENLSDEPMPAGLGLQPYFIRTPQTRVYAAVEQMCLTDDEIMPLQWVTPDTAKHPKNGVQVDQVGAG